MTAAPVKWVLDEFDSVVDDQPASHPLRRVDRDNALLYDGGGAFDMSRAMSRKTDDFKRANYVGARFADRDDTYIGTGPDLDAERVIGVRVEGYGGDYGHIDPLGEDGVVFQGTDNALVQQLKDALYSQLRFPDAGRTPVSFTHLSITNATPAMANWQDYFRYDFDVVFDGFETL